MAVYNAAMTAYSEEIEPDIPGNAIKSPKELYCCILFAQLLTQRIVFFILPA
jgi:hypothetical protein